MQQEVLQQEVLQQEILQQKMLQQKGRNGFMKRLRSILLMLVLLLSMSIPAFAEGIISTDEGSNSASKKVTINYDPPAQITGVSITVKRDGEEVQPSNGVYCILPDSTVTLNVTGINLKKATNQNLVNYSAGASVGFEGIAWTISEDGKSASKEVAGSEFAQSTSAYTIAYTNDNDTWINTDVVVRYDDGTPAVINGMSMKVTENGAEVPPENDVYTVKSTSKVTLSITGTNLHRPKELPEIGVNGIFISLRDEGWSISEDWKSASIVLEGSTFWTCETAYELQYEDSQSNWSGTGIFIQYDAGPKAEITGVSIKVTENGMEVLPKNGVYLISPTSKVILTVTGTNLQNRTSSNSVFYAEGRSVNFLSEWDVNETGTSASYTLVGEEFDSSTAKFEIFYTNGDSVYVDTGLFVRYDDGTAEKDKAVITDVTVKVGGESYTSGTVLLTPSSGNVTITIKGTNFENLSADHMLYYVRGIDVSCKGVSWKINVEENTAESVFSLSDFEKCTEAWRIRYSNDGGTTRVDTNISILYRADVTSVDLSWGSMNFTYSDAQENGTDKGWSCEEGADKITVTNSGTVKVSAGVSYRQAENHTEITGSFDQETQTLAKDETKYFVFTLSGKPSSALENAEIGAVTVEITKAEE